MLTLRANMFRNLLLKNLSAYRSLIALRGMSEGDIADRLRKKGLADESRYFRREQEKKLRKLKEALQRLENTQEKLEHQLKRANELLSKLRLETTGEESTDEKQDR